MRLVAYLIALVGIVEAEEELLDVLLKNGQEEEKLEQLFHIPHTKQITVPSSEFLLFYWRFPKVHDIHYEEFRLQFISYQRPNGLNNVARRNFKKYLKARRAKIMAVSC